MLKLLAMKNAYLRDESGATAIEYGLIAAGIALAILAAVGLFGDSLDQLFRDAATAVDARGGE